MTIAPSVGSDRHLRGYPAYRDSGVDLYGNVPAKWKVKRLRHVVRFQGGGTPSKDNLDFWNGSVPWVSPKDMKSWRVSDTIDRITHQAVRESATRLVPKNSVLMVVRSGILNRTIPVGITECEVALNQDLKALIPSDEVESNYLAYLIDGLGLPLLTLWRKEGATVESLEMDFVGSTPIPIPSNAEQRAIGSFLDRETARIDALVAKKERLIELLQEKRTALITHAVTKGLDPSVPMKPSGVGWLGEIPAHWEVKRLWHLTPSDRRIMYGIVLPGPHFDGGVPIVKGGDVKPGRLRIDRLNRTDPGIEAGYERSRLRGGDIVYAIRGSIGDAELVPAEIAGANLTQDAARIAPREDVCAEWLLYAVKSEAIFRQLEVGALGATIRGINIRDLKRALLPAPPHDEQAAIADHLGDQSRAIERMLAKIREGVARLNEFRSAVISAAVTGKIDVQEEAA